jgi:hypothetical protein
VLSVGWISAGQWLFPWWSIQDLILSRVARVITGSATADFNLNKEVENRQA